MGELEGVSPTGGLATIITDGTTLELVSHGKLDVGVHSAEGLGVTSELGGQGRNDESTSNVRHVFMCLYLKR